MHKNNINALNHLPEGRANELLGHHYIHNPKTECVYDLHNRALEGATLVLGIEE